MFVDVTAYNSKKYYVLGDVAAPGQLPITGNETVLDALNFAGGLIPTAAPQNIRLVRPAPPGACCEQVLPVNLAAIISGGDPTTNYQLMPGDRLVVYRDPIVRTTIFIDRLAAPFQTVLNSILQYSFTARSVEFLRLGARGARGCRGSGGDPDAPNLAQPARGTLSLTESLLSTRSRSRSRHAVAGSADVVTDNTGGPRVTKQG